MASIEKTGLVALNAKNADRRRASKRHARRAFSMVEALIAVTITAIAGGALLTSIGSAVQTSSESTHTLVAQGLAEQLMDEIAATRFPEDVPVTTKTGITESALTRDEFENIDEYSGWKQSPPTARDGSIVGTEGFQLWNQQIPRLTMMRLNPKYINPFSRLVDVERVEPDSGSGWTVVTRHTNHRRVTVRVNYLSPNGTSATLSKVTRIFSYVPAAP